jgi:alpha-D-ribose 1-methylphosphonate 5-triphosphate synthase subunit PhnI
MCLQAAPFLISRLRRQDTALDLVLLHRIEQRLDVAISEVVMT